MPLTGPAGRGSTYEIAKPLVNQERHARIEQRHVYVLTLPGPLSVMERGEDADRCVEPRRLIGNGNACAHRAATWLVVGTTGDAHESAHGLGEVVVAGLVCERPVLAEPGDGGIDDVVANLLQRVVVETLFRQRPHLEVLHHDVALASELSDKFDAIGGSDIDRYRPLASVDAQVVRGLLGLFAVGITKPWWSPLAGLVANAGTFDLDDVGAEVGKDLGAGRACEHSREIQHTGAAQSSGEWEIRHGLRLLADRPTIGRAIWPPLPHLD